MTKRKKILITNDDGFRAQGIQELALAFSKVGDVTIVAPDGPRSGASGSITSLVPISLKYQKDFLPGVEVYTSSGTPVDCVKLALNTIFLEEKPDLLISGINHGRNDGICVLYSGTIGSALEGAVEGIPTLAVSFLSFKGGVDFSYTIKYALQAADFILNHPLPPYTILSLNTPEGKPKGLKICAQTNGRFVKEYVVVQSPSKHNHYWMSGYQVSNEPDVIGDMEYLNDGYATLVPIQTDMTNHKYLETLREIYPED